MTAPDWTLLLDPPPFPADGYGKLADRVAALIGTRGDVVFVQAEAVVALEAAAVSLARPGLTALNIVTSPYGALFGGWLTRAGASVVTLKASPAAPVRVDAVAQALERSGPVEMLALVHAESASGILNPLPDILALARARGIVTVVDAVASVGGHELEVDQLGIDICVIGPQKALGGPAGLSAMSVSDRGWSLIERPGGRANSVLSLLDLKRGWLEAGRGQPAGMPAPLEWHALASALDRIEAEGMVGVIARHAAIAAAARRALPHLGLRAWPEQGQASNLVTAALLPDGIDRASLLATLPAEADITAGIGAGTDRLIRLNHTGTRAPGHPCREHRGAGAGPARSGPSGRCGGRSRGGFGQLELFVFTHFLHANRHPLRSKML